jgi:hypothetical protein
MALESLSCTGCGSTDVKEVKPDTYFCNHCDTIFKQIDPSKVTVAPTFCSCGNPIQVQCQICRMAMCADCNAFSVKTNRYTTGTGLTVDLASRGCFIPTIGYGYVIEDNPPIIPARIPESNRFLNAMVIYAEKLLWTLQQQHNDLKRVCWNCVGEAIPDAAAAIAGGVLCEGPYCANPSNPNSHCECCHRVFCNQCCREDSPASIQGESVIGIRACRWCAQKWSQDLGSMLTNEYQMLSLLDGKAYFAKPTDRYIRLREKHRKHTSPYVTSGKAVRLAKQLNREQDQMNKAAAMYFLEINGRLETKRKQLHNGGCTCSHSYRIQDDRSSQPARTAVTLFAP